MTLSELNRFLVSRLAGPLGEREAAAEARLLIEDILGYTRVDLAVRGDTAIEPETEERFKKIAERIEAGEPPQYITGKARFMGMELMVNSATLIPRPETEELVDRIVDRYKDRSDMKVLDIGTGSGCIAISLSRGLPFAKVTAVDISPEALEVAKHNARLLHSNITFIQADILDDAQWTGVGEGYDIIVSNPPYIADSERASMETRVKDYEPATALFVPDADPLKFYNAILGYARLKSPSAYIFFEINPLFVNQLKETIEKYGYKASFERDSFGKTRFAVASPA